MKSRSSKLRGLVSQQAKRFMNDTSGNITMMIAVSAIPLLIAVGAGLDSARMSRENATFHASVDAAAIAIGSDPRSATAEGAVTAQSKAELIALAKSYILANYSSDKGEFAGDLRVDVNVTENDLRVIAKLKVPTTLMRLAGVDYIDFDAEAAIAKARRPVELVLVMDTTGSMSSDNKMTNAKAAAHDLLEKVYGGSRTAVQKNEYLRVALVPFAATVRVDPTTANISSWVDTTGANPLSRLNFTGGVLHNHLAWTRLRNSSGQLSWNGCLEARRTPLNVNDDPPSSGNPNTLFPPYFAPDEPSIRDVSSYDPYGAWRGFTFSNSYIGEDTPPGGGPTADTVVTTGEAANMSVADKKSMTVRGLRLRLMNPDKYTDRTVSNSEANDGPWAGCTATPIVPMTYNREAVEAGIDAMVPRGNTNIAEGLAWGMRVISPTEPFSRVSPRPGDTLLPADTYISEYDLPGNFTGANALKKKWQKVMLLMTDGDNAMGSGRDETGSSSMNTVIRGVTNHAYSSYGLRQAANPNNRYGSASTVNNSGTDNDYTSFTGNLEDQIDADMSAVCTAIKNNKVTLYVTSFGNGVGTETRSKLSSCATPKAAGSTTEYYQHSTTGTDLTSFFNGVGRDVLNKMIYVAE